MELVFEEHWPQRCHLTKEEAIGLVIHEADTSGHPGYSTNDVNHMMRAWLKAMGIPYSHKLILRLDRRAPDGGIWHPYAGDKDGVRYSCGLVCRSSERAAK
jgi:hypothetical protein